MTIEAQASCDPAGPGAHPGIPLLRVCVWSSFVRYTATLGFSVTLSMATETSSDFCLKLIEISETLLLLPQLLRMLVTCLFPPHSLTHSVSLSLSLALSLSLSLPPFLPRFRSLSLSVSPDLFLSLSLSRTVPNSKPC